MSNDIFPADMVLRIDQYTPMRPCYIGRADGDYLAWPGTGDPYPISRDDAKDILQSHEYKHVPGASLDQDVGLFIPTPTPEFEDVDVFDDE